MFTIFYYPYYKLQESRISLIQHCISKANSAWYVKTISH